MKIMLRHGLEAADRPVAARLYWRAFGAKLGRVMRPEAKALAYIERVIDPRHVICALGPDGTLLGVIGFRTAEGSFVGGDVGDLRAVYGRFGGGWRAVALGFLAQDLPAGTVCIDGLAVTEAARGKGLGEALIGAMGDLAMALGAAFLRLEVVDENLRARALYDRLGFVVTGRADRWITALIYGYRTAIQMEKRIAASRPEGDARP